MLWQLAMNGGILLSEMFVFSNRTRQSGLVIGQDGWMTCDLTSFSTSFESYQDDG